MALEKIQKANDIKELTEEELKELSDEIRRFLIEKISGRADYGTASVFPFTGR